MKQIVETTDTDYTITYFQHVDGDEITKVAPGGEMDAYVHPHNRVESVHFFALDYDTNKYSRIQLDPSVVLYIAKKIKRLSAARIKPVLVSDWIG